MTDSISKLEQEATRATKLLKGKVVAAVIRHQNSEVLIQFTDGTRLFVDKNPLGVELSITGGDS
ncbi:MAG: hypothetical protein ACXW1T_11585 [Methylophilus sp.]